MSTFWAAVEFALFLFYLFLIGRFVVETTRSFARSWRPAGLVAVGLEVVYQITDPPVRLLRRFIPPLRLGGISLDLSLLVLVFLVIILREVAYSLASSS